MDVPWFRENTAPERRISIDPCHVFSESYQEARSKFREAVQSLGLSYEYLLVVPEHDYTIDIAVIPGGKPGLVIHSSGVHGVEGYAGSAVQVAFLEYLQQRHYLPTTDTAATVSLPQWPQSPPPAGFPTVILVHAVNPFGMALYRRTNENNVDLNRNGLTDQELQTLATSHVNHQNYQRLDAFFNPLSSQNPPSYFYAYFLVWMQFLRVLFQEGFDTTKAAMVAGQYYKDKGIFYGGSQSKEASVRLLEGWLQNFLDRRAGPDHDAFADNDTETVSSIPVTWVDVHTGLGPMGVDSLLVNTKGYTHAASEANQWFPNGKLDLFSQEGDNSKNMENVSKGYEHVQGILLDYYAKSLFASQQQQRRYHTLMVGQEFGTIPAFLVAHALVLENAAYFSTKQLSTEEKLAWAKRTTGRAFYPKSPKWRRNALERGITVLFQAMTRSAQSPHLQ
ncbi:hypothetical protein ACA910_021852 [Epithemia clementina (nom. ined.)]